MNPAEGTAEEPPAKASALAAEAEDRGIGGLPAQVQQERHRRFRPGLGDGNIRIAVGVRLVRSRQRLVGRARNKVVPGADDAANRNTRHPRAELPVPESHDLAVEDIHAGVVPQVAETERCGRSGGLVSKLMNAAGVAGLCLAAKALGDAEGFNITDDRRSIDVMKADGRMREGLALIRVDHIRGRRQKSARLALQRQVLRGEPASRQSAQQKDAKNQLERAWQTHVSLRQDTGLRGPES